MPLYDISIQLKHLCLSYLLESLELLESMERNKHLQKPDLILKQIMQGCMDISIGRA